MNSSAGHQFDLPTFERLRARARARSHTIQRDELEAGDHIYSPRTWNTYTHHGIYVGDGKVIHFMGGGSAKIGSVSRSSRHKYCPECGPKIRAHGVVSSCLDCFLKKGKLLRYRYGVPVEEFIQKIQRGCTTAASDPPEAVIYRAKYLLQNNGFGKYDLQHNNCEDFSLYCKTEIVRESPDTFGCSSQIRYIKSIFDALFKNLEKSFGIKCAYNYYKNDIGVPADDTRIPVEQLSAERLGW